MSLRSPHSGAAPGTATEAYCLRCDVPLGCTRERQDAALLTFAHYEDHHPDHGRLLLEGCDVLLHPAPYRCDLCSEVTEPPWWTYTTDSSKVQTEDPQWLVCDTCALLVKADDTAAVVSRSLDCQQRRIVAIANDPVAGARFIADTVKLFMVGRLPGPIRGWT
jgi:5-methylcytosine-specific restriction endonuclease McrA